jgi:anti-sigma B factor antagonist
VEIETTTTGPATVLNLDGYLDSFSVNYLKDSFNKLFDKGIYKVIVNLTAVGFVDSAGLGQLVSALRMCVHNTGNVVLVGANESITDLLKITKLDTVFKIYDTIEEAGVAFKE